MPQVVVAETSLGPDLPTLRIGAGPRQLVYLPGLSLHPGLPTGQERRLAESGWEPLIDRYTVHRVGRRVRPVGTTFGDMADDVADAIVELGAPVDLMGASTGGMVALHVAASRPDLVRRLVLVISGARLSARGRFLGARTVRAIERGDWRRAFSMIMRIGATSRPMEAAWTVAGWLLGPRLVGIPSDPTLVLAELKAWMAADARPVLPSVVARTLVIGTAKDAVFPPAETLALGTALPNASVVLVPDLAHDFPPRALADHVAPFLAAEEGERL